jgi:hypothetical protein
VVAAIADAWYVSCCLLLLAASLGMSEQMGWVRGVLGWVEGIGKWRRSYVKAGV